jgi:hypothetical protein
LALRGVETGGPSVQMPTRQSFGTRLIEQGFVGELRGEAHLSFEPSGVVCKLDIPLASLVPVKPGTARRLRVVLANSRIALNLWPGTVPVPQRTRIR